MECVDNIQIFSDLVKLPIQFHYIQTSFAEI